MPLFDLSKFLDTLFTAKDIATYASLPERPALKPTDVTNTVSRFSALFPFWLPIFHQIPRARRRYSIEQLLSFSALHMLVLSRCSFHEAMFYLQLFHEQYPDGFVGQVNDKGREAVVAGGVMLAGRGSTLQQFPRRIAWLCSRILMLSERWSVWTAGGIWREGADRSWNSGEAQRSAGQL